MAHPRRIPSRSASIKETALESEETARQKLVTYFKDLNYPAGTNCPVRLEEESLAKERQRRELMLLMTISREVGGWEEIKGLEEWLERIEGELKKVDSAVEKVTDQMNKVQDYKTLAEHMDQLFGQLLTIYE